MDALSSFQGEFGELKSQVNLLVIVAGNANANSRDRGKEPKCQNSSAMKDLGI